MFEAQCFDVIIEFAHTVLGEFVKILGRSTSLEWCDCRLQSYSIMYIQMHNGTLSSDPNIVVNLKGLT